MSRDLSVPEEELVIEVRSPGVLDQISRRGSERDLIRSAQDERTLCMRAVERNGLRQENGRRGDRF